MGLMLLLNVLLNAGPVQFSGSASLQCDAEFISGDTLRAPYSALTFTVNPCLSIYGIPIYTEILLSTMESDLRQALNKFRIGLDPIALIKRHLPMPGFIQYLPKIDIGTFSPSYSPLTLSGVPVTGFGLEYQPWKFYLAGAGGRISRAIEGSDTTEPVYERMLYAGKFGFGKKEASHIYFTLLYAQDDSNSIARNWRLYQPDSSEPADTFEAVRPQENYSIGMEYYLCLFEDIFQLEGEVVGSELTRDIRMDVQNYKWVPDWVERILKPRLSSQYDFAFAVRPVLNVFETRISGELRMVGPGFVSLGAPSLRNDNLLCQVSLERSFLDNALVFSAGYNREQDNLIGMKLTTTTFTGYSFNLGINFPNFPYVGLNYAPYFQKSESLSDRLQVVSLNAGYSFETGAVSHSPSLAVSYQQHAGSNAENNYSTVDLSCGHSLGFSFPLSVGFNLGFSYSAYGDSSVKMISMNIGPSYTLLNSWTNGLSLNGSFEKGNRRIDIGLNSTFPVWKIADASVSIGRNIYRGADGGYQEWCLSGGLTKGW